MSSTCPTCGRAFRARRTDPYEAELAADIASLTEDDADLADPSILTLDQLTQHYLTVTKPALEAERRAFPKRFRKDGSYTLSWQRNLDRAIGAADAWSGKGRVPYVTGPVGIVKAGAAQS